jgi:hypothetical protein
MTMDIPSRPVELEPMTGKLRRLDNHPQLSSCQIKDLLEARSSVPYQSLLPLYEATLKYGNMASEADSNLNLETVNYLAQEMTQLISKLSSQRQDSTFVGTSVSVKDEYKEIARLEKAYDEFIIKKGALYNSSSTRFGADDFKVLGVLLNKQENVLNNLVTKEKAVIQRQIAVLRKNGYYPAEQKDSVPQTHGRNYLGTITACESSSQLVQLPTDEIETLTKRIETALAPPNGVILNPEKHEKFYYKNFEKLEISPRLKELLEEYKTSEHLERFYKIINNEESTDSRSYFKNIRRSGSK